ncbi:MAG: PA2779 family protein [Myxococcota bacterium]
MRVVRGFAVHALCLVLAGALVSLPVSARAAEPHSELAVAKLVELGVSPEEAQARIAALDDAELAALATNLESQPAGGKDGADVAVAFLVITGIVFITLIITDATGVTDIFPWVKKPGQR